jgi:hypothetical protein
VWLEVSIFIKGMEMPKSCAECPVNMNICKRGYKYLLAHMELYDQRANDCPISSVPPHGRLIDADALIVDLMDRGVESLQTDDWHEIQKAVADAPTIIPAEEGKT